MQKGNLGIDAVTQLPHNKITRHPSDNHFSHSEARLRESNPTMWIKTQTIKMYPINFQTKPLFSSDSLKKRTQNIIKWIIMYEERPAFKSNNLIHNLSF